MWGKCGEMLLTVIMRGILGIITICFVNSLLEGMGIYSGVGVNALTVLTSGILGFPGTLALYGFGLYNLL